VLQRPFAVGQALVPALFDSALSLALAAVASTVGIGFDTGTAPLIQQIVTSTQSVLTAVTTLNPINVLNAIQHGFADVTLNLIKQLDSFTTGTLPFIRDTIVAALKVTPATAPLVAAVAQAPEATLPELAAPASDTGTATSPSDAAATPATAIESPAASTPVDVVEVADEGTPVDTVTAEPVTVDDTIVDVPETATVVTPVATTEEPAAENPATKGSTSVTRDSLRAEPGKSGLASGTEGGSQTQTESNESTVTKPASEAEKPSSTPSDNAGTSAGADSRSGSDSDNSGSD
jgi:hypothetical protein